MGFLSLDSIDDVLRRRCSRSYSFSFAIRQIPGQRGGSRLNNRRATFSSSFFPFNKCWPVAVGGRAVGLCWQYNLDFLRPPQAYQFQARPLQPQKVEISRARAVAVAVHNSQHSGGLWLYPTALLAPCSCKSYDRRGGNNVPFRSCATIATCLSTVHSLGRILYIFYPITCFFP